MKFRNKSLLRVLSAVMAVVLLLACLPCCALADSFSAAVSAQTMYVSADAYGSTVIGALPRYTIVTVTDVYDGVAHISYLGRTGYARVSDMMAVDSFAEKAVARVNTYVFQQPNVKSAYAPVSAGTAMYVLARQGNVAMVEKNGVVGYTNLQHLTLESQASGGAQQDSSTPQQSAPATQAKKAVAAINTYVFQRPDIRSAYLAVSAGTTMNLLATNGNAAMVERNGVVGYTNLQHLIVEGQSAPGGSAQLPQLPSLSQAFQSGKYSNEQLCYLFLTQVMGYNTAAAAGVLANINYESGFKTSVVGDSGTSYGICQWHASRRTRLFDFCASYGVSADSLVAQLAYLKYELETFYPLVHNYLRSVSNSPEGAYDAGYFFCYNFENPANRESKSVTRGSSAQNTYYKRYASV